MSPISSSAPSAMPQSVGDISGALDQLEPGAFHRRLDGVVRDLIGVDPERRFADFNLEWLNAGNGLQHAGQAVDAAAAGHAVDDEGLVDLAHLYTPQAYIVYPTTLYVKAALWGARGQVKKFTTGQG